MEKDEGGDGAVERPPKSIRSISVRPAKSCEKMPKGRKQDRTNRKEMILKIVVW